MFRETSLRHRTTSCRRNSRKPGSGQFGRGHRIAPNTGLRSGRCAPGQGPTGLIERANEEPPYACRIEARRRPTCIWRSASRAGHEEGRCGRGRDLHPDSQSNASQRPTRAPAITRTLSDHFARTGSAARQWGMSATRSNACGYVRSTRSFRTVSDVHVYALKLTATPTIWPRPKGRSEAKKRTSWRHRARRSQSRAS